MNKKARLSEFHRSNILAAANRLFREKGTAQTTVDDIAKLAEYSKSTVYVYFKSKEDIYNNIVLQCFSKHKEAVVEALKRSPGFPEGYFAVCGAMAMLYEENPLYFESTLGSIDLPGDETDTVLAEIYNIGEEINDILAGYVRTCASKGHVRSNIPPRQATFTLWAALSGVIMLANKKEAYIKNSLGITKEEFMRDGFAMLLASMTKEV